MAKTHTFNAQTVAEFRASLAASSMLGEAVLWSITGVSTTRAQVAAALSAAGLDEKEARKFQFRNAFRRAIHKLKAGRIIRVMNETRTVKPSKKRPIGSNGLLSFQFTAEFLRKASAAADNAHDPLYDYDPEGVVILDKVTGVLTCPSDFLLNLAKSQMDAMMDERRSRDVTAIIGRLYAKNANVIHVIGSRGVFFVPAPHVPFTAKIDAFLANVCNSRVTRLPIPSGTVEGNRSIRESITQSIDNLIDDYVEAVEALSFDATERKREAIAHKIAQVQFQCEAYTDLLGDSKDRLMAAQEELKEMLRAKFDAVVQPVGSAGVPEPVVESEVDTVVDDVPVGAGLSFASV